MERASAPITVPESGGDDLVWLPAIVWAEALVGVRLARNATLAARRRARLASLLNLATLIPFDEAIAEHYADIYHECARKGCPIPQNDIAVAATARALQASVLVGPEDESHFKMVKNLNIVVLS